MEERFYQLRKLLDDAFSSGDFVAAKTLAQEYLQLADNNKKDWNYGNAIHHANLIIGRIALKEGNIETAKEYLLKASQTPGSPQLNSFGPNMLLAKELLEIGETAVVLEYFDLCAKFWQPQFQQMFGADQWKEQIESGQIPDFKANLVY